MKYSEAVNTLIACPLDWLVVQVIRHNDNTFVYPLFARNEFDDDFSLLVGEIGDVISSGRMDDKFQKEGQYILFVMLRQEEEQYVLDSVELVDQSIWEGEVPF